MSEIARAIADARAAQADWERQSARRRTRPAEVLRTRIGADPAPWVEGVQPPQGRTTAETLAAEIGPLADACRWLEKRAPRVLRPRREEAGLFGTTSLRVRRKPHGVVLVIGAGNYPLYLLAAPAIQALIAGNAVLLKPPPGGERITEALADALREGAGSRDLVVTLESSAEAAQEAIAAGVDHVVATGSSQTGRAVARSAAETLTPCTLECSGSDAVIVLPGADLDRVVDCVVWGLTFNSGATCIGPRRLITVGDESSDLPNRVVRRLATAPPCEVPPAAAEAVRRVLGEEFDAGSRFLGPKPIDREAFDREVMNWACDAGLIPPVVLQSNRNPSAVEQNDLFAPILACSTAKDTDEAIHRANASPYALGSAVFGPADEAERVAKQLRVGCVTINDLIAPTADPRVPFGGAGESGYGVTRGVEGLLAMTRPQAIVRRRGRWLPHLDPPTTALDDLLAGMIQSRHAAGWSARLAGLKKMMTAAGRHQKEKPRRGDSA